MPTAARASASLLLPLLHCSALCAAGEAVRMDEAMRVVEAVRVIKAAPRKTTPASVRRSRPQQPAVMSNLPTDQVLTLLSEAGDAFFVCEKLGLQAKRALACTCSTLRPVIFQLLRQPRLVVQESDAIWDNACFVANVLVLNVHDQALCVAGETCAPEMKLAHLRTLPRLKVGEMGPTAALFFGAAIAESDSVLRLSTGTFKSLKALREKGKVNLRADISQGSDRDAMFGALMQNPAGHAKQWCWPPAPLPLTAPLGRAWLEWGLDRWGRRVSQAVLDESDGLTYF